MKHISLPLQIVVFLSVLILIIVGRSYILQTHKSPTGTKIQTQDTINNLEYYYDLDSVRYYSYDPYEYGVVIE